MLALPTIIVLSRARKTNGKFEIEEDDKNRRKTLVVCEVSATIELGIAHLFDFF